MSTLTLVGGFEPITFRGSGAVSAPSVAAPLTALVSDRLPKVEAIKLAQSVRYKMNSDEHMIFLDALEECTVLRKVLVRE